MSSIDKRIVQMEFNNQGFESGVSKTLGTLQKLNEKLKMKSSADGLDNINKSVNTLNKNGMLSLASGVETITQKFSTLGVIGTTALVNITNSAIDSAKKTAKALTIEPVMTGFQEYETKMGSIQTILTNTAHAGTKLSDVTKTLDELNLYADKTIYNFAEMTKNIGTFTAAGIDLETSTAAIKGIANLAAASGSSSAQASTAMYQLSQALAAGKVSLMDWNSVVNAGMGGKLFQDALIRTSQVLGTNAEGMIKKFGSFRESLTKGEWLTSEVLTETLKQLSGAYTEADLIAQGFSKSQAKEIVQLAKNAEQAATQVKTFTQLMDTMKESVQSGWSQSWEYIIGDKDQAAKFFTAISDGFNDIIEPSVKARNEMLKTWNEIGGRDDIISGLGTIVKSIGKGFGAIGDAWRDVFPAMTGEKLAEISKGFKELTDKFKMSDGTATKIRNTFKGLFSVIDFGKNIVVTLAKSLFPLTGLFGRIGDVVITATNGVGKFVSNINDAANKSGMFEKVSNGINGLFTKIGDIFNSTTKVIEEFFGYLSSLNFDKVFGMVGTAFQKVGDIIGKVADGISKAMGTINFDTLANIFKTGLSIKVLGAVKGVFEEMADVGESAKGMFANFSGMTTGVKEVLTETKNALQAYQDDLQTDKLIKIAGAIAILAGAMVVIASIDTSKLLPAIGGMTVLLAELTAMSLALMNGKGFGLFNGMAGVLMGIGASVLLLSTALKVLSDLGPQEIVNGIFGITASLGVMFAAVKLLKGDSKGLSKTSRGLIVFGAALHVMASAIKQLGSIDADAMGSGLFAIAVLLTELSLFLAAAKFGKLGVTDSVGILLLSSSLLVLSQAVKEFGSIDTDELIRGLASVGAVLLELSIFSKLGGGGLGLIATGAGLTVISAAMLVMSKAIDSIGRLSWEKIAKGMVSLSGALTILGVASKLLSGAKLVSVGVGMSVISASLLVLSKALDSLSGMSWEEIGRSLVTLAGALTVLSVAMLAMTGSLGGAAAMLAIAGALALLTPQLVILSKMNLTQVGIALAALGGAFTVLGLAGLALTPVVPTLIGLAGAITLLGIGSLAAGAGIAAFGTGLGLVGTAIGISGFAMIEFVRNLINLLPQLGTKAGEAMVTFATAIQEGAPAIITAIETLISGLLQAIGRLIPEIAQVAIDVIIALAEGLANGVPKLIESGIKMVLGILEGIAQNIGQLVTAGVDCVLNFINGVSDSLPKVIDSAVNLALNFIEGVADGLINNQARLETAIRKVIEAVIRTGVTVITGGIGGFIEGGKALIEGLIGGAKLLFPKTTKTVQDAIKAAKDGTKNVGTALRDAGKSLIEGLKNGIMDKAASVAEKARSVVEGAINAAKRALKINSPSRVFREIGQFTTEGFVVGLNRTAKTVIKPTENIANTAINTMGKSLRSINKLMDGEIDSTPVIAPVMDLSNVRDGARRLNGILTDKSVKIDSVTGTLASSIGKVQNGTDNSDIISALKDLKSSLSGNSGPSYTINGITYDDGSNVVNAVETLVRAAKIERRI